MYLILRRRRKRRRSEKFPIFFAFPSVSRIHWNFTTGHLVNDISYPCCNNKVVSLSFTHLFICVYVYVSLCVNMCLGLCVFFISFFCHSTQYKSTSLSLSLSLSSLASTCGNKETESENVKCPSLCSLPLQ